MKHHKDNHFFVEDDVMARENNKRKHFNIGLRGRMGEEVDEDDTEYEG